MADNKLKGLQPVLWAFIIILISVPFIVANANTTSQLTNSQPIINESINVASAKNITNPYVTLTVNFTLVQAPTVNSNVSLASFTLTNNSGSVATLNTDYSVNLRTGQFSLLNTTFWSTYTNNLTRATYNYYNINYVNDPASRSMFSIIDFMSALGILIIIVGYYYRSNIFHFLEHLRG